MTDTTPDIFIIAKPESMAWLDATIETARKWLRPAPQRMFIVGHDDNLGPNWVDGRKIVGFGPTDIPVLKTLPEEKRAACFRSFLKWSLATVTGGRPYLAIESGTILNSECRVNENAKYVLARERLFHFPDSRMHNWLFGRYPLCGGWFVPSLMVFDPAIVTEIVNLIQKRYTVKWFDAVLNILNGVPDTRWCAAQAYGAYVEHFHRDKIQIRACRHARRILTKPTEGNPQALSIGDQPSEIITRNSDDPAPLKSEKPVLRISSLGVNGRFGNQIFQYAFLRLLARERGMEAQCPQWIGNSLFGHSERWQTDPLPLWTDQDDSIAEELKNPSDAGAGAELWGYFQYQTSFYRPKRDEFRALFQPLSVFASALDDAINRLRGADGTLVGIHLRRGDYAAGVNFWEWEAPTQWYLQWLGEIWPTLHKPVLYVASDDPTKIVRDFADFSPKTAADLGVNLKGAEFYPDFFALTRCDHLAISNSTFSFAAAMLNCKVRSFVRPDPILERLEPFDPWDSEILLAGKTHQRLPVAKAA
jgi:hypothetical protein